MDQEGFQRNLRERWWFVFGWGFAGIVLCQLLVGMVLYTLPKKYESLAVVRETPGPAVGAGEELPIDSHWAAVPIKRLDLDARWPGLDRAQMVDRITTSLRIRRSADGTRTEIRCLDVDAQRARDLVVVVLAEYEGWHRFAAAAALSDEERLLLSRNEEAAEKLNALKSEHNRLLSLRDQDPNLERASQIEAEGKDGPGDDFLLKKQVGDLAGLEARIKLLQATQDGLASKGAQIRLPNPATLVVDDHPTIARAPSWPKVNSALGFATMAGMLLGLGLWWLHMARWRDPEKAAAVEQRKVEEFRNIEY